MGNYFSRYNVQKHSETPLTTANGRHVIRSQETLADHRRLHQRHLLGVTRPRNDLCPGGNLNMLTRICDLFSC